MRPIIFDLGNVIFNVNFEGFYKRLDHLNVHFHDLNKARSFVNDIQTHQDLGITNLDQSLRFHLGIEDRFVPSLIEEWNKCITPCQDMFDLVDFCKKHTKVAIVSNMGEDHFQHLISSYPQLFENTDLHISYQVGARKPSKLYFQSLFIQYPEYKNSIYVDDRKENLKAAQNIVCTAFDSYKFTALHFDLNEIINQNALNENIEKIKLELNK